MRCTVKKLARESVGKAHAKNMRIIIPGKEPFFTKSGAPNDRFLGNDLKWFVMHPGVL